MKAINQILEAINYGNNCLICDGETFSDFYYEDGRILTIKEGLRKKLLEKGIILIEYSLDEGPKYFLDDLKDEDKQKIQKVFQTIGLTGQASIEQRAIFCDTLKIKNLLLYSEDLYWKERKNDTIKLAVLIRSAELWVPKCIDISVTDENTRKIIYIFHDLSQNAILKRKKNILILEAKEGCINDYVANSYFFIKLPHPTKDEKEEFIKICKSKFQNCKFENDLSISEVANITASTPNLSIYNLISGSHENNTIIKVKDLIKRKEEDILKMSEGTLKLLDVPNPEKIILEGSYINFAKNYFTKIANSLKQGNKNIPRFVVLVGPPGAGKTQLAYLVASKAGVPAFELISPKSGIVGETERKARLQQSILKEIYPNVGFIDEVTEALPMERSDFDGDSGASKAVLAAFLTFTSDPSIEGKSLLIGTTNCPWRISEAMRSRIHFIPIFHPSLEDFIIITQSILKKEFNDFKISNEDSFISAINKLYLKGAIPRDIVNLANNLSFELEGKFDEKRFYEKVDNFLSNRWLSIVYADLWALKVSSNKDFFPWYNNSSYNLPAHFNGIIDIERNEVNFNLLDQKINELKPFANL